jgi:hypothetical protein
MANADSGETGEAIDARRALVMWALGELGEQNPNKYYRVACKEFADRQLEHSKSWCGIFCLAGLHAIGVCDWQWSTKPTEPGFVFRLRRTTTPEPGDIVVFQRGEDGSNVWHHAIVQDVRNGRIYTIDGNVLRFPKEGVATRDRPWDENASFFSIGSLLRDP